MPFLFRDEKFGSGTRSATLAGMHRDDTLPWPVLSWGFSNLSRRRIQKKMLIRILPESETVGQKANKLLTKSYWQKRVDNWSFLTFLPVSKILPMHFLENIIHPI